MKLDVYNQKGEKTGTLEAPKQFFDISFKGGLIHEAYLRQLANGRVAIAHTKTKAEVRGGGRKPYPQKGTGQARQGSIRNPHYMGGGVAFGPRNNANFEKLMPKKMRRLALFSALSQKARENSVMVLEDFTTEKPSAKAFAALMKKLPIKQDVLLVTGLKNETLEKSARNVANVKTISVGYMNIKDFMKYSEVLFLKDALEQMEKVFTSNA
ncbi:MAG: 50S ribosomal protein L4 [Candidatus Gracilibacteria bacterium]